MALTKTRLLKHDFPVHGVVTPPPPGEKITKIIRPEYFYVILGGGYGKNYVITKKLIPQELFSW